KRPTVHHLWPYWAPPNATATASPASAKCLRPRCPLPGTVPTVAERSTAMVLMLVSIGGAAVICLRRGDRVALPGLRAGGRTGRGTEIGRHQRPAAETVDQHRIGRGAGLAVDDHDARPFRGEMLVAPG